VKRALGAAAVALVLTGACTGDDDAGPSPTTEAATPSSIVDYSGVVLPGVGGETTTTIDETGTARLVGTVTGPRGPVAGATIRIERLVAGREVRKDVIAAADGRWELKDVPGGRYRVRAFLAPVYAQTSPEVRFLADDEEHTFDLTVEDQRGIVVRADVAPDQPVVDGDVNLVVLVAQRTVSPDGVVRSSPLDGSYVELLGLGRWVLRDDDDGTTSTTTFPGITSTTVDDGAPSSGMVLSDGGRARYELRCERGGAPGLALRVPVLLAPEPAPPGTGSTTTTAAEPVQSREDVALELPDCSDPEATTTTTPSTSTP
jgi:hypothetical protein